MISLRKSIFKVATINNVVCFVTLSSTRHHDSEMTFSFIAACEIGIVNIEDFGFRSKGLRDEDFSLNDEQVNTTDALVFEHN